MRTLLLAATIAAIGGLAAGCGGSGDSAPVSDTALSAAEWRQEANALCRRIGQETRDVRPARHGDEVSAFVAAVAPLWKQELDSTRALGTPAEIAAAVSDYVGALDYLNRRLVEMHIAAERQDSSRLYNAGLVVQDAARDVKLKARSLRLPTCAARRIP